MLHAPIVTLTPGSSGSLTLALPKQPGKEFCPCSDLKLREQSLHDAGPQCQGRKHRGLLASWSNVVEAENCPAALTPMEALTPLSCAELARTFVLWPRNLTRDLASTLAPLSLPCLQHPKLVSWNLIGRSCASVLQPGAICRTAGLVNH